MISYGKSVFAINKCIEIIDKSDSYSIAKYSSIPNDLKFYYEHFIISIYYKNGEIKSVKICKGTYDIDIVHSHRIEKFLSTLYEKALDAVSRIEEEKFKKIFDDYTIVEHRDSIINDILDNDIISEEKSEEKNDETKQSYLKRLLKFIKI